MDLCQISTKEQLIRNTLTWTLEYEGVPEETYLAVLKSEYEGLDIGGVLTTLDQIDAWRKYRNEIIHGLLNKNVTSVDSELKSKAETGMEYARFIDSQVKALKKKNVIRNKMKIKRQTDSVHTVCYSMATVAERLVTDWIKKQRE